MAEYTNSDEEEISLVELFAVLLRRRKLIILGTLAVTFLAGIYLFVLPKFITSLDKREVKAIFSISINPIPAKLASGLSSVGVTSDLYSVLSSSFRNLPVVAQKYKDHPFLGKKYPSEPDSYNMFISEIFSYDSKKKDVNVAKSLLPNICEISVKIQQEDFEEAELFIRDIVQLTNDYVSSRISEILPLLKSNTETSIKRIENSSAQMNDINTLQNLHDLMFEIEKYYNTREPLYTFMEDSFVIGTARGRMKKLAMIFVASFAIFIFLAYLLSFIEMTMSDPESKKIITDAWESGK